ncbi:MAG: hypothetical protein Q8S22_10015 [Eubacteriales bacterium]|nr:hypothetical protein [Eubacteriales bacterium]
MISVLGLSPDRAKELLALEGVTVTLEEVRSRKGVEGGTQVRVIRQTMLDAGHAALVYAVFRTEPIEANPEADRFTRNK